MDFRIVFGGRQGVHGGNDVEPGDRLQVNDIPDYLFTHQYRMNKATFQALLNQVGDVFVHSSKRNNPVPPETCVLVSLRLLSSGSFQCVSGVTVSVSQATTSRILKLFCETVTSSAIWDHSCFFFVAVARDLGSKHFGMLVVGSGESRLLFFRPVWTSLLGLWHAFCVSIHFFNKTA